MELKYYRSVSYREHGLQLSQKLCFVRTKTGLEGVAIYDEHTAHWLSLPNREEIGSELDINLSGKQDRIIEIVRFL